MIKEFRQCGTQVMTLDDGEPSDNPASFLFQMLNMTLREHEANLLKFDQQRFVTGELEPDSHSRLKCYTCDQIEKLKLEMENLRLRRYGF